MRPTVTNLVQPRLPITDSSDEPVWCSMCGSVLTQADHFFGIWACQCEGCREVLQERVRRIMKHRGVSPPGGG